MQMDDPENPKIIEDLICALGATPVVYPYRNECCGGYIAIESPADAKKKSNGIMKNAESFGVDMVVTACPLCRYNLDKSDSETPVVYFTELLAIALGVKEDK
jgi:heterodisulfide reductase subunit B